MSKLTYQFRLRFFVKGDPITYHGENQNEMALELDDKSLDFRAFRKEEDYWGGEWHVITCGGFPTEPGAREAGERCKSALYMTGVEMRRSINLGKDEATSRTNDELKKIVADKAKEHGYDVQNYDNVHGLAVYAESPTPIFFEVSGYGVVGAGAPRPQFDEVFAENYRKNWRLNARESLACALYGAAQTEVSTRAKFLFLVSVIESLIESEERDTQGLAHVEHLIRLTEESELPQPSKSSLLGSLKWLRYESINHMGKRLIAQHIGEKEYGGKRSQNFFRDCYSIRSNLLHTGTPDIEEYMLPTVVNDLDNLVQDILHSILQKAENDGD